MNSARIKTTSKLDTAHETTRINFILTGIYLIIRI